MQIKFKKLHKEARVPVYSTEGAGAFDFHSTQEYQLSYGEPVIISTGLAMDIPKDHALLIFSRSGHGFNHNIRLSNSVGVIDSDYRGEIFIKLSMDFPSWQSSYHIKPGDRIAQGLIIHAPRVSFEETEDLTETKRGANGLGSTG